MTALNRAGWRPEMNAGRADDNVTFTGNRALMLEEPLIFEIGSSETTGVDFDEAPPAADLGALARRSEEHTSELQSLMRISYAVFCLKKKKEQTRKTTNTHAH